jgi:hypothetical protein
VIRRSMSLAILVLILSATEVWANGFGFSRRTVEVRYPVYYSPPIVYVPMYYSVAPPVVFSAPLPLVQYAVPQAAPPLGSLAPPVSVPRPRVSTEVASPSGTTTHRPGDSAYSVLAGPAGMGRVDDRCSVAFWNLAGQTLTLRIDGREFSLPPGRSLTRDLPRNFAWHVGGRESEATHIPAGRPTAEILIHR